MKFVNYLTSTLAIMGCSQAVHAQQRPNFLIIVTDDQTYESIHCLNNPEIQTPNMDKLAQNGTAFLQAFNQGSWSSAVSVASRSMLITGQNLHNAPKNKAYLNDWSETGLTGSTTEVPLWGETFGQAGYETFMTGKWHNSEYALLKSFNKAKAVGKGMYESVSKKDPSLTQYDRPEKNKAWQPYDSELGGHWVPAIQDIVVENGVRKVGQNYSIEKHTSELYADEAIHFLHHYKEKKPFFMYVAFNAPHDPRQSPQSFVDRYPRNQIRIPANYLTEHPFDQGDNRIRDEMLAPFPRTEEAVRLHRQEYYAIISHVDSVIGCILKELNKRGLDKNTYVIFTSDHGLAVGMHGLMGKQNQYDHSVRMPLIFRGPGIGKGVRVNGQVYMQSLYATTCELAGIPVPSTVDFKSLVPLLKSPDSEGEKYIYGSYRGLQYMIRTSEFKLIVYPKAGRVQLFDLKNDPYEITDLSESANYQDVKRQMYRALEEKWREFEVNPEINSQN